MYVILILQFSPIILIISRSENLLKKGEIINLYFIVTNFLWKAYLKLVLRKNIRRRPDIFRGN